MLIDIHNSTAKCLYNNSIYSFSGLRNYSTCPAGPLISLVVWMSDSSNTFKYMYRCRASLSWAVFSHLLIHTQPLSSTQSDKSIWGCHSINPWVSVTRSFVYAGGQPFGTYSRQLWPLKPCHFEAGDELCGDWHFLGSWFSVMLTPSCLPSSIIKSPSGHGCPHLSSIVRPSALLPEMICQQPPRIWYAAPDFNADRAAALSHTSLSFSRRRAQVGNTASSTKSHRACNWNELFS